MAAGGTEDYMKIIISIGKLDVESVIVMDSSNGEQIYFRFPDGQWEMQIGGYQEEGIDKATKEELEQLYQKSSKKPESNYQYTEYQIRMHAQQCFCQVHDCPYCLRISRHQQEHPEAWRLE